MGKNCHNQSLLTQRLNDVKHKHNNISHDAWSAKSGVPKSTLSRYLSSSLNMPNFPAVCAMLKCLGESIDEFYESIDEKIGVPADALKLEAVPVEIVGEIHVDVPETKLEIQERIIRQAEEIQMLRASEREKDMQIEMLTVRLETMERTLEAVKALCSAR